MGRLTSRETAIVLEEKAKSLEAQGITPHTRELEYIALAKYENAIEDGELLPVKRGESDKDKFIALLQLCNIEHEVSADGITLDSIALEGDGYLFIKFYEGGKFQEFIHYPE